MAYTDIQELEGIFANACLQHGLVSDYETALNRHWGNPYASIALTPDIRDDRVQVYTKAVESLRAGLRTLTALYHEQCHEGVVWPLSSIRIESGLGRLEEAAKGDDVSAFLTLLNEIDWDHKSAAEFIRGIDLSLEAGAHVAARDLAIRGAELHFNDDELQKYARVLGPPARLSKDKPSDIDPSANIEWLKANKDNYKGNWVAIKDGELVGVADSYEELVAQVGNPKGTGILTTKIY